MEWTVNSVQQLQAITPAFIKTIRNFKRVVFYGEMGVGKTTFIKAICKELGVEENVSSPTFSLVNEYHTNNGEIIYHFDFYRINSIREVYDIGYEDYFFSDNICLIEWPEKIEELLDEEVVKCTITSSNNKRKIVMRLP